jgi:hypothetical protein
MAKSTSKLFQSDEPKEMKEDAMNLPEESKEEEAVVDAPATVESSVNDIQDIDISAIKKKRFRINGDNNKIIELNTSDMNISSRLSSAYDRLLKYMTEVSDALSDVHEDEEISEEQDELIRKELDILDKKMCEEVDYIFDAPVSKICSDGGSMYDPFEGAFRFEHIIEALAKLYENNLDKEFSKMRRRVQATTSKFTKKYNR